jgi:hypothetical protein
MPAAGKSAKAIASATKANRRSGRSKRLGAAEKSKEDGDDTDIDE